MLLWFATSSCGERVLSDDAWKPRYEHRSTLPYGTYITYSLLDSLFDKKNIHLSGEDLYSEISNRIDYDFITYGVEYYEDDEEYYEDYEYSNNPQGALTDSILSKYYSKQTSGTIYSCIIIMPHFEGNLALESAFFNFVGTGNNVFISAETIDESLLSYLSITSRTVSIQNDSIYQLTEQPKERYIFPPLFVERTKNYSEQTSYLILDNCKLPYEILGVNKDGYPSFVKVKYGFGYIYLHTTPRAFANITMIDTQKYQYGMRSLSHLSKTDHIIWDESLKRDKNNPESKEGNNPESKEGSLFHVIFKSESLTWGLIVLFIGLLLYMLFRGKRTQRAIPILETPQNMSLAFLDTLSNMFYTNKDYAVGIKRRHAFLLDFIRRKYYMDTESIDNRFIQMLEMKSNVPIQTLSAIFNLYSRMEKENYADLNLFMNYNKLLEKFYKITKTTDK